MSLETSLSRRCGPKCRGCSCMFRSSTMWKNISPPPRPRRRRASERFLNSSTQLAWLGFSRERGNIISPDEAFEPSDQGPCASWPSNKSLYLVRLGPRTDSDSDSDSPPPLRRLPSPPAAAAKVRHVRAGFFFFSESCPGLGGSCMRLLASRFWICFVGVLCVGCSQRLHWMASRCAARVPSPPCAAARSGWAGPVVSIRPARSGVASMMSLSIRFSVWLDLLLLVANWGKNWDCSFVLAGGRAVVCAVSFRPCIDIHKVRTSGTLASSYVSWVFWTLTWS